MTRLRKICPSNEILSNSIVSELQSLIKKKDSTEKKR